LTLSGLTIPEHLKAPYGLDENSFSFAVAVMLEDIEPAIMGSSPVRAAAIA
jgi:hypothetical protein